MNKTGLILLSLVLLCSTVLSGCLFEDNSITPAEGGVLNLYGIDPWTLDPALSSELTSHRYVMQIFSGLVRLGDENEPVPDIAEDWYVSSNGTTYTFELRDDVRFQNGRGLVAEDFKYSWERACNPETGSQTAPIYLNDIVGVNEVLNGETEEISGVRVINDYTIEVTIDAPKSYFLSKMAYPTAFVVDRENVGDGEWWREPNGTGPFKLGQWDPKNLLILERNELYYGEMAGVGSVVFKLWGGIPINMYELGEIDVLDVSVNYIDKVTDESGSFYTELSITPELSFYYIGFDCTEPPFDDVNIRRAFSHAIDKDKLVSLVYRDMVQRADGIIPQCMPGYNPDLVGLEYDVDLAKELIANSSYGDVSQLPEITITTLGWGGLISDDLEAIVYQWRQNLGVEVKVRQLEPERFYYHLIEEKDEMYYTGWIADYPHPQDFMEILFYSGNENNYGEYSNPELDSLLEQAGLEVDEESGIALYQQAEQAIVDDAACLPLFFGENYYLVKPYVKGYEVGLLGIALLNTVYIETN